MTDTTDARTFCACGGHDLATWGPGDPAWLVSQHTRLACWNIGTPTRSVAIPPTYTPTAEEADQLARLLPNGGPSRVGDQPVAPPPTPTFPEPAPPLQPHAAYNTFAEPCPGQGSDAPSAPNRAPTDEAHVHDWRTIAAIGVACPCGAVRGEGSDPSAAPTEGVAAHVHKWVYEYVDGEAFKGDTWGCAGCQTLSLVDPTVAPTDPAPLPERLRAFVEHRPYIVAADLVRQAADALEDLTRENERLRDRGDAT